MVAVSLEVNPNEVRSKDGDAPHKRDEFLSDIEQLLSALLKILDQHLTGCLIPS